MSLHWININPRFQEGVNLINSVNRTKFNLLLKHIVQSESADIFTRAELAKLSESLKLDDASVHLLIQTIAHVFKQSSKIILKPTVLQEQLVEKLNFNQDKAEDFVKKWTQETKKNFDVENSKNLDNITWELDLQTASSVISKESHINTRLQLNLVDINGTNKENVTLELDEEQLGNLYATLEKIQNKLDSI